MKKIIAIIALVMMIPAAAMAGTIDGTAHDLSSGSGTVTFGSVDQTCEFCHAPHGGGTDVPLWNRNAPVGPFGVYTSGTMDDVSVVAGVSAACMSCHDGVTALDSTLVDAGGVQASAFAGTGCAIAGDILDGCVADLGLDLTNDHPIGVDFTDAYTNLPVTAKTFGGLVECASCHNVHDDTNGSFLIMPNTSSALCQDCHTY